MGIAEHLPNGAAVLIDTSPIIYVLEGHKLGAVFLPLFKDVESGRLSAICTAITLAEVVSGPLAAGKESLAERYRAAITTAPGWSFRAIDDNIAMLAARLRLRHRLCLPDAIQLAVAVTEGCDALVTHDRDFGRVKDLKILGLDGLRPRR